MSSRAPKFGVGADIESIARFRRPELAADGRLLNRIFTPAELRYCRTKRAPAPSLAARFAAKEAVFKALSRFGPCRLAPKDIEVIRGPRGVPTVRLAKGASRFDVRLSLSHSRASALAFAVVMERP